MNKKKFRNNMEEIFGELMDERTVDAFYENLTNTNFPVTSFSNLFYTYLLWNELGSEEDIKRQYWEYDEDL